MRVLVVGCGVIGSVYAARLLDAGHQVALVARGQRLSDLREHGLQLCDTATGQSRTYRPAVSESPDREESVDLVLVAVRREQFSGTLPLLAATGCADVVFFGNTAGLVDRLAGQIGARALFGFPAAGGVRDGPAIRYVLIRQQRTMLAEQGGERSGRLTRLSRTFEDAGFRVHMSPDLEAWLIAHTAFVVPIAFALYRLGVNPTALAADRQTVRLMVRATREAFRALQADGNREIPLNLRALYLSVPESLAVQYWRRTFAKPRGELWFAAHTRAAPEEMQSLAEAVLDNVGVARAPALTALIGSSASSHR